MKPLVSVIVPMYNAAPFIGETLESIIASTYRPIEVIIVDDGSTDESLSLAQSFAQHFTFLWRVASIWNLDIITYYQIGT